MKHKAKEPEKHCDVEGCSEPVKKSLSRKKVEKETDLKFSTAAKHAHLCKEHYKTFKKATKTERKLDRLAWK